MVLRHRWRIFRAAAEIYTRGIVETPIEPVGENPGQVVHESGEQPVGGAAGAVGTAELAQPKRQAMAAGELHASIYADPFGVLGVAVVVGVDAGNQPATAPFGAREIR